MTAAWRQGTRAKRGKRLRNKVELTLSSSQTSHTHNAGHHIVEVACKLFTYVTPDATIVRPIA